MKKEEFVYKFNNIKTDSDGFKDIKELSKLLNSIQKEKKVLCSNNSIDPSIDIKLEDGWVHLGNPAQTVYPAFIVD